MIELRTEGSTAILAFASETRNLLSPEAIARLEELVDEVARLDNIDSAIIVSDREEFILGGDLDAILRETDVEATFNTTWRLSQVFRRIERSKKPYAVALNATALGGGFELALACHWRVSADDPKILFGLPEAKVGLMPGAGGTQRLPRMLGVQAAMPYLLKGTFLSPQQAKDLGLIDELADPGDIRARAMEAARRLAASGEFAKPWDLPRFAMPQGEVQDVANRRYFMEETARMHSRTQGNSLGEKCILAAVYQGCQAGFDAGLKLEARKFAEVATSQSAKATIYSRFFDKRRLRKEAGARSVQANLRKTGVIGLGLMGCGIAYVAALAGSDVVLMDQNEEAIGKGVERILKIAAKAGKAEEIRGRLHPAASPSEFASCDLVIEAVFEDRTLKSNLLRDVEAHLRDDAILASNTSSIPIAALAQGLKRPECFLGLHFFSPVDRMELLEVVPGAATSADTLGKALDIAAKFRKSPIVVRDVRGFYTGRVFAPYLAEAFAMVAEGYPAALIENGARRLGMPIGPLALADAVSISLQQTLRKQEEADGESTRRLEKADRLVDYFVDTLQRPGRAAGKGFYDYDEGGKRLWTGYGEHFPPVSPAPDLGLVMDRLLYIQLLDTLRCLEDGTVGSALEADVGAILGWGFPDHLGGPCRHVDLTGAAVVAARAQELAQQFGERFSPPEILLKLAREGGRLHSD